MAQAPAQPYATINRDAVSYAGPGRDAAHDLAGTEIKIGFLTPLQGPRKAEGEMLLQAAQLAIEDEAANPLPAGRRLVLAPRDEGGPWGRASSEIVRLVFDDPAVAVITSLNGGAAHLAEQVGNKIGVPVLTLSTDTTTTQINLPWIFRLGPSDAAQARAFAHDIYRKRGLRRVILVTERDHDGRVGGEEFEKAARDFTAREPKDSAAHEANAPVQVRVVLEPSLSDPDAAVKEIVAHNPEALVFWTGPETAIRLVERVRQVSLSVPIYLCQKAAQAPLEDSTTGHCKSCPDSVPPAFRPAENAAQTFRSVAGSSSPDASSEDGGIWIVAVRPTETAARESFVQRYRYRAGSSPTVAAAQAYDAVRIIAATLRRSGPNRARLRDALAAVSGFAGASGIISFDHAGNDVTDVMLVRLP